MPADFLDRADFHDADRGFISTLDPCVVTGDDGSPVWDMRPYEFLRDDAPDTVNPSLWRQCQLTARHGLYLVCDGIYQVRGFDLSNMTLVESDNGVIVIDPLISAETAAAALELYRGHRGDRSVTAVIYTHPHLDHFGGVLGVVDPDTTVPIIAPAHFMEHAVSENVYAGTAMLRRGSYYSGSRLPASPTGRVGMGLGQAGSTGTVGLLAPTLEITGTGQREVVDGVTIDFQITPGTEAPAEMNFLFPDHRAVCLAENVTHNLHNIVTLRGAQVRDARMWSRYIAEAVDLFVLDKVDVAFASHHWPTWGTDEIVTMLTEQRDLYAYLHDQTLRLLNQGHTGSEIAESFEVPPRLDAKWHTHGYYGSVSHNVKAIYQRYMGWYDGNPAHLWQHPPEQAASRYVGLLGGIDATIDRVREYIEAGDLRFAAELGGHAVFADPDNPAARAALAEAFRQLGHGAENATWRNCFLVGAHELEQGIMHTPIEQGSGLAPAMTVTQLFDTLSLRIVGPRAWSEHLSISWVVTDTDERFHMELSNGALVHFPTSVVRQTDLTVHVTRNELVRVLATNSLDDVETTGDRTVWTTLTDLTDQPDVDFPVVTPR